MEYQALRDCLIKHSIIIRGEFVTRPLNITQAADRRDAFVKVQSYGRRGPHVSVKHGSSPHWWRAGKSRDGWASPDSASHLPGDCGPPSLFGLQFLAFEIGIMLFSRSVRSSVHSAFASELRHKGQPSSYVSKPMGFTSCLLRASMDTSSCGLSRRSTLQFSLHLARTPKMCEEPLASWTYLALKISRTIGMKISVHPLSENGRSA